MAKVTWNTITKQVVTPTKKYDADALYVAVGKKFAITKTGDEIEYEESDLTAEEKTKLQTYLLSLG